MGLLEGIIVPQIGLSSFMMPTQLVYRETKKFTPLSLDPMRLWMLVAVVVLAVLAERSGERVILREILAIHECSKE